MSNPVLPERLIRSWASYLDQLVANPLPAVPYEASRWLVLRDQAHSHSQAPPMRAQTLLAARMLAGAACGVGFPPFHTAPLRIPDDLQLHRDAQQQTWTLWSFEWNDAEPQQLLRAAECVWVHHQIVPAEEEAGIVEVRGQAWNAVANAANPSGASNATGPHLFLSGPAQAQFSASPRFRMRAPQSLWQCETVASHPGSTLSSASTASTASTHLFPSTVLPLRFAHTPVALSVSSTGAITLDDSCPLMAIGDAGGCAPCVSGTGCKWLAWPYCTWHQPQTRAHGSAWFQQQWQTRLEPEGFVEDVCLQATLSTDPRPKRGYARRQTVMVQLPNGWQCCFTWMPSPDPDQGRVSPGPHFATWAQIHSVAVGSPPPRHVHAELRYEEWQPAVAPSTSWYPTRFRLSVPEVQLELACSAWPVASAAPTPQHDGVGLEYWSIPLQAQVTLRQTALAPAVGFASFRGYENPQHAVPRLLQLAGLKPNLFFSQVFLPRPACLETILQADYLLLSRASCSRQQTASSASSAPTNLVSHGFGALDGRSSVLFSATTTSPQQQRQRRRRCLLRWLIVLAAILAVVAWWWRSSHAT